jgi:hypothetical protein
LLVAAAPRLFSEPAANAHFIRVGSREKNGAQKELAEASAALAEPEGGEEGAGTLTEQKNPDPFAERNHEPDPDPAVPGRAQGRLSPAPPPQLPPTQLTNPNHLPAAKRTQSHVGGRARVGGVGKVGGVGGARDSRRGKAAGTMIAGSASLQSERLEAARTAELARLVEVARAKRRVRVLNTRERQLGDALRQFDRVSELHGFGGEGQGDGRLAELLAASHYTRRELYIIFARFKALCAMSSRPTGVDLPTFRSGVARLTVGFGNTRSTCHTPAHARQVEDDTFVQRVFHTADLNHSVSVLST